METKPAAHGLSEKRIKTSWRYKVESNPNNTRILCWVPGKEHVIFHFRRFCALRHFFYINKNYSLRLYYINFVSRVVVQQHRWEREIRSITNAFLICALPVLRDCVSTLCISQSGIQIRGCADIIAANELTSKLVDWQAAGNRCTRKPKPDDSCLIGQCETLRCMAATIDCIILSNEMHWLNGSDALVLTKCASCRCRCSWQGTSDRSRGHLILTEYLGLFMRNKIRKNNTRSFIVIFNSNVNNTYSLNWNMRNNRASFSLYDIVYSERVEVFNNLITSNIVYFRELFI